MYTLIFRLTDGNDKEEIRVPYLRDHEEVQAAIKARLEEYESEGWVIEMEVQPS